MIVRIIYLELISLCQEIFLIPSFEKYLCAANEL
jgi:hypothetical protein